LNLKNRQIPAMNQGKVQVSVKQYCISDFKALEEQWLQLEQSAKTSFFLSWKWIGCWLNKIGGDQKIYIIKAQKNSVIVGLGIFVEQSIVRHNFIASKQWYLHRTGIETKDQIWIENNGFLMSESSKDETHHAMWHYLLKNKKNVDEYIVYVAKKSLFTNLVITNKKYDVINELFEFGYKIQLDGLSCLKDYLSQISKNTRQQFNRSIKHLAKQGDIEFTVIEKPEKQLEALNKTQHWHINKWHNTSTPSGFENKEFCQFHHQLLQSSHPTASTLMATLTLNEQLIGCIYCLSHEKNVYFYLSCLKPFSDNKIKLGIIMHIFMIEWLISNNNCYSGYDFMAGDARYKSSLSSVKDEYLKFTLQSKAIKFKIENTLKKMYKILIK